MKVELRPLRQADADHLRRWSEDDETARLQGARSHPLTEAGATTEVGSVISGHGRSHLAYMIEADGATIGNCWLGHLDGESASLGIVIGEPEYRGRGIGTQVMRLLLDVATERGIGRVYLWTLATNEPAIRTYLRVGFRETGRTVRDVPRSGRIETVEMEWRAGQAPISR